LYRCGINGVLSLWSSIFPIGIDKKSSVSANKHDSVNGMNVDEEHLFSGVPKHCVNAIFLCFGDPVGDSLRHPVGDPLRQPVGDPLRHPKGVLTGDPKGVLTGDPKGVLTGDPKGVLT